MNNFLKLAYEAGAQQAMIDLGVAKIAAPVNPNFGPPAGQVFKGDTPPPAPNLSSNPVQAAPKKSPVANLVTRVRDFPVDLQALGQKKLVVKGRF